MVSNKYKYKIDYFIVATEKDTDIKANAALIVHTK